MTPTEDAGSTSEPCGCRQPCRLGGCLASWIPIRKPLSACLGWPGLLPLLAAILRTLLDVQGRGCPILAPWSAPQQGQKDLGDLGAGVRGPAPTGLLDLCPGSRFKLGCIPVDQAPPLAVSPPWVIVAERVPGGGLSLSCTVRHLAMTGNAAGREFASQQCLLVSL